ncbi:MAG: type II toxin-antitoxin system Phd/YefM family antitoxin [Gallionella sp.]|nr:type II toxin-antitoxin system Phd/YefM family antitoxin [Gallionella sp.]
MQVSMREFKTHLSQYVGQAQSGQSIELTSYRKVVARLVGVSATESAGIAQLLASGVASWQGGKPVGAAFELKAGGKSVSAMVLEDRG